MKVSTRFRVIGATLPFAGLIAQPLRAQESTPERDYWPTEGWRTADPEDHGMPADLIAQIDERVAAETPLLSAMIVIRGGDLVVEQYYNGFEANQTIAVWSVAKSVTTIGVGIAFREGLLTDLNQTLGDLIPDLIPADADPRVVDVTLQHLLTSTSGWEWDARTNFMRHDETDQLDLMLSRPMVCSPGECFEYDSTSTNLLSYIIGDLSGVTMAEYLQPLLFDPLGIDRPEWLTTEDGATRGAGGLDLTAGDMAKLGYLYLNGGEWDGQHIVDEEWVTESTREQASGTSSISGVNVGGGGTYGYQWWITEPSGYPSYLANGYGGQTIYVVPELDLVVAAGMAGADVNEPENSQPVLPIIEELIIPAAIGD